MTLNDILYNVIGSVYDKWAKVYSNIYWPLTKDEFVRFYITEHPSSTNFLAILSDTSVEEITFVLLFYWYDDMRRMKLFFND